MGMQKGTRRVASLALLGVLAATGAQGADSRKALLFQDVRVFDGVATTLSPTSHVLVVGNRIETVSRTPITPDPDLSVSVIEGQGRTLMPGLIDAHVHLIMAAPSQLTAMTAEIGFINLLAADMAKKTLMQGFTTVRDVGGPVFGLKRAIDMGLVPGPRIFPSGAVVSQTAGHGDFRLPHEVPRLPGQLSYAERVGMSAIADSPDEVRLRVREQLMLGASQIKLAVGGGVSSVYDPLDANQYTPAEIRAAVEAAENWGTYVTVHAYTPASIRAAIEAGVKCIEHGQLADEASVQMMAKRGVWWSLQPFLMDEDANPQSGQALLDQQRVAAGTARAFELSKKHGVRVAFGTDLLYKPSGIYRANAKLAKLARWYSPGEVLRIATGWNGELLALSGQRAPYPGPLGVVRPGALADLLLVDGDPVADIRLIEDPERNFVVIVKDGQVVKDSLPQGAGGRGDSPP